VLDELRHCVPEVPLTDWNDLIATDWQANADQEHQDAANIRHNAESLDRETQSAARRAALFDAAEVFLEIATVLCSIALMTGPA